MIEGRRLPENWISEHEIMGYSMAFPTRHGKALGGHLAAPYMNKIDHTTIPLFFCRTSTSANILDGLLNNSIN